MGVPAPDLTPVRVESAWVARRSPTAPRATIAMPAPKPRPARTGSVWAATPGSARRRPIPMYARVQAPATRPRDSVTTRTARYAAPSPTAATFAAATAPVPCRPASRPGRRLPSPTAANAKRWAKHSAAQNQKRATSIQMRVPASWERAFVAATPTVSPTRRPASAAAARRRRRRSTVARGSVGAADCEPRVESTRRRSGRTPTGHGRTSGEAHEERRQRGRRCGNGGDHVTRRSEYSAMADVSFRAAARNLVVASGYATKRRDPSCKFLGMTPVLAM
jgi:hypothetical protein